MIEKNKKIINKSLNTRKTIENFNKEKEETSEKTEKVDKSQKYKNKYSIFIKLFILIIILIIILFFSKNEKLNVKNKLFSKKNIDVNTLQEDIDNDFDYKEEYNIQDFQEMSNELKTLEKGLDYNNQYIKALESKIEQLELKIAEIKINPQKVELIKLSINIQNDLSNNTNYSQNLEILKSLSKDNPFLLEKILILEQNKNIISSDLIIKTIFDNELKKLIEDKNILKNQKSKISKFFSNFIIIRKLGNNEENSIDFTSVELENAMKEKNYSFALNILNNNQEYDKYFAQTISNLKTKILLNQTIKEIINYIINN